MCPSPTRSSGAYHEHGTTGTREGRESHSQCTAAAQFYLIYPQRLKGPILSYFTPSIRRPARPFSPLFSSLLFSYPIYANCPDGISSRSRTGRPATRRATTKGDPRPLPRRRALPALCSCCLRRRRRAGDFSSFRTGRNRGIFRKSILFYSICLVLPFKM